MSIAYLTRVSVTALVALVGASSVALATTYAGPPVEGRNFPNRNGDYEQAYVTTGVNVRAEPGTKARIVNRLSRGNFVNVGECRANWCFVDVRGGNGWVLGRFIGRGENPYSPNRPAE